MSTRIAQVIPLQQSNFIPTFHILIATAGRPCLRRMMDSLKNELTANDAITIIFDGKGSIAKTGFSNEWLDGHLSKIIVLEQEPNLGYWGHGIRNSYQGLLHPRTTFIMHADDDDVYTPGSFYTLRAKCTDPLVLYVASMYVLSTKVTIPSIYQEAITYGDIGTPCGIIPFEVATKSTWKHNYGGDFDYYDKLKSKVKRVVFLHDIIYCIESKPT